MLCPEGVIYNTLDTEEKRQEKASVLQWVLMCVLKYAKKANKFMQSFSNFEP